jgi:hypothetical protein
MMIAFTYLPGFVTMIFHSMPTVWCGRHRLILCWLVFMQAVHPGRHTLAELECPSARELAGAGSHGHFARTGEWHSVSLW